MPRTTPRLASAAQRDYRGWTMRQAMELDGVVPGTGRAWVLVLALAATAARG